jgi:soluble lytic murein transglycosylase-like protein
MRLQIPLACRVRNRLTRARGRTRWRPRLWGRARGLPIAIASLGLLAGAGAAGFATGGHVYVVQPGDSLWAISQANGLTVQQLAAANNMNLSDILLIGRHLLIPSNQPASRSSPSARPTSAPATENAWVFCSSFSSPGGPWGVLPDLLQQSPDRLALQPLFIKWADHYNLSLPLLEAIAWQESGWQQGVVSSAGAVGTGQIMPQTARFISGSIIGMPMNINSVSDNIRMSAAFLAYLAGVEGNNRCATIAAYYEGPDNLSQYGVFPDAQAYVASVEALIPRFE